MSHTIWFKAPLTCIHCGSHIDEQETRLYTSSFNPDPIDRSAHLGEVLPLHLDDFEDGYLTLRHPGADPDVRALEYWGCPICGRAQWVRLDFHCEGPEQYRFISASTVSLTPDTLREMHFISRWMDLWVQTNPKEETASIRPLIEHLLP